MPIGLGGIVCRECGGSGCQACGSSGYSQSYFKEHGILEAKQLSDDIVPMPYGKILPDLTDCSYPNIPWPQYLDPILCPNCGSDNVVGLDDKHNPDVVEDNNTPGGRWFCISCQDSWCYEREH